MATQYFGVVYSIGNVHVRRYVYSSDDSELDPAKICHPGEGLALVSRRPYLSTAAYYKAISDAVTAAAGKPPATFLDCACVDANNVVDSVIHADASVDTLPGFTLIQSYDARVVAGCSYDPATGLFTIPGFTTPGGIDDNGDSYPPVDVPPFTIPKP
jgi:hypothetical protein